MIVPVAPDVGEIAPGWSKDHSVMAAILKLQKQLDVAAELLRRHQQVCYFEGLHNETAAFLTERSGK